MRLQALGQLCLAFVLATPCAAQWPTARPVEVGLDPAAIEALERDLASGRYGLVDGIALVRNGRLAWSAQWRRNYDSVYRALAPTDTVNHQFNYDHPAWHPWYRGSDLHTLQSVTKSVTSILVGIALARGEIASLDTPIVQWFDTTRIANLDDRKRRITLRHILTMSPGIAWNESLPYTDPANSAVILEASSDWVGYVINLPMSHEPGTHWAYSSGASQLMGAILVRATGRSVADYAREHLFAPLGIDTFYWKQTPTGLHDTEGGLYLRTEDLARIAWLYHERGAWNGRQLVPASWVEQSLTASAPTAPGARFGYGFQWWLYADPTRPGKFLPSGSGYGGQFPMIFPDDSMVVVINQWNIHGPPSMGPPELARRIRALLSTAP
jgi:CubicO group peptidase (beta-lactamase class C family)